ncbi:MAG: double zinc ribbon domain-containing protein [Acidimicrobiales bacterium]
MGPANAFTSNYQDLSTREGYQFSFSCMRCGNGYSSTFQRSALGFGGRLAAMGGGLLGGGVGSRVQEFGFDAEWMRDGTRGKGWDKAFAAASTEVQGSFHQCHRCGQWVCGAVCWNEERGLCVQCAPKLDQELAGMQAAAQIQQVNEKVQARDWTKGVNVTDVGTAICPSCEKETGGGKFCQACGHPLAAAPGDLKQFCSNCGTELSSKSNFCPECGLGAGT